VSILALNACSYRPSKKFESVLRSSRDILTLYDTTLKAKNVVDNVILGAKYRQQGDFAMAVLAYQDALEADSSSSIHYALSDAYFELKNNRRALIHAIKAVEKKPIFPEAMELLAEIYLSMLDLHKALTVYEDLVKIAPTIDYMYSLARLYEFTDNADKAIILYKKCYELAEDYPSLLRVAELYNAKNDLENYEETLYKVYIEKPENAQILHSLTEFYFNNKKYESLLQFIEIADSLSPTEALANNYELLLNYIYEAEIKVIDKFGNKVISKIDDRFLSNQKLLYWSAAVSEKMKDSVKADYFYTQMLNVSQNLPELPLQVAFFYYKHNNLNKASEICSQYTIVYPKYHKLSAFHASVLFALKKYYEASIEISSAISVDSTISDYWTQSGDIYMSLNNYTKAEYSYNKAFELDPKNGTALNNHGYYLVEANQNLTYAHKLIQKALELEPNNPSFLDSYAWLKYKMGDYVSALTFIEKALEIDNTSSVAWEHKGDILLMLNRKDEAITAFKKASELDKREAQRILKKIE